MTTVVDEIRRRASEIPEQSAIVEFTTDGREHRLSYADLVRRVDACVADWESGDEAPIRAGDRCGLLAAQGHEFIIYSLAILQRGQCLVPISEDYGGEALQGFIEKAGLHGLWDLKSEAGFKRLPRPDAVDDREDESFRGLNPAYLRFTSGTTNSRKGVILSHQGILERLDGANQVLKITPEDRVLWLLPMAHHLVVSIFLYLRFGATILLPQNYYPSQVVSLAREEQATVFYASPYHYDMLSGAEDASLLKDVRLAISTATGLTSEVAERFYNATGLPLSQALGVIEMGLPVINTERAKEKPLSLGQVLPHYDVWIRGEDGSRIEATGPDSGLGEICIHGPGAFAAYLNPWTLANDVMKPDGFRTGDLGYFDEDGDLFLLGRRHNRINMAGMKFFCEEVESVLQQHPAIQECVVKGESHPRMGEIPVADVVVESGNGPLDLNEIFAFCRDKLSKHKIPMEVRVVQEIPKTPTGKIKRW
ncbi:MAG: class I adenylate-forming enzyme family protein [Verrucomicrobiota bacterium]